ncbi:hypothetical protein BB584_10480 [Listeria monocytogenes]|uniref:hypothetical protein n=1 Tax=Listeria monocytogenes TaxID=1639 RepID=UPI0004D815C4|nr:hypothetical protein [Listeria monocytogenes]EAA0051937.1 CCA-adding enzyme [Listeria monocytogenes]EAA0148938.1 CCA-adding enzyme [Listeria monocytogenes]EAA0308795.1 CCA-adding enzyme [Listeria monocytogenes]EAA0314975.1 CCA-adding enzyme [Listeria monocytogenes]EAC3346250.1 CCA-adding enzyme [Listeria monocytogenes]
MTETEIRQLKTADGIVYYPLTHIEAVKGLEKIVNPPLASTTENGLMSKEDKLKIDSVEADAEKNNVTDAEKLLWNKKQDAILIAPNGTAYVITVDNQGNIKGIPYVGGSTK